MMYCLRSYIPLLLLPIPLSLSPVHFSILLGLTCFLNRPCVYCSLLLIILFSTSCYWSQRCLVDFNYIPFSQGGSGYATWFLPRLETMNEQSWNNQTNETLGYLATALADSAVSGISGVATRLRGRDIVTDLAPSYLSSVFLTLKDLFRREWVIPCIGVRAVL